VRQCSSIAKEILGDIEKSTCELVMVILKIGIIGS